MKGSRLSDEKKIFCHQRKMKSNIIINKNEENIFGNKDILFF